ncbi:MAG: hypothetical protein AB4352_19715 [Hormoscilla sp.]
MLKQNHTIAPRSRDDQKPGFYDIFPSPSRSSKKPGFSDSHR